MEDTNQTLSFFKLYASLNNLIAAIEAGKNSQSGSASKPESLEDLKGQVKQDLDRFASTVSRPTLSYGPEFIKNGILPARKLVLLLKDKIAKEGPQNDNDKAEVEAAVNNLIRAIRSKDKADKTTPASNEGEQPAEEEEADAPNCARRNVAMKATRAHNRYFALEEFEGESAEDVDQVQMR